MADLSNNLPVIGVVKITDARLLYNNQPVIGVRVSAAPFVKNKLRRGVAVLADGATLHNDQPVIGVSVISDADQKLFNNQEIMPVVVISGSLA